MNKEIIDNCKETVTDRNIVLREKKSIYRAINRTNESILIYKVDGCIYKPSNIETRCDYLLNANQKLYFIELKGSNVQKGLRQVLISINNLVKHLNNSSVNARIITTRGTKPKRLNTYKEYRDLIKLIGKEGIVLSNSPFQEHIT
ncbi:hypothetical protein IMCC3317_33610 [Kordia antarctica]|uniref:Uncharacterized protein n=1 Tax=Kordia antarctica TaxID=1218801 RepID=A0A7L4ZMM8_9FLAO|nr:hypothetical protein [Kordia antarctica]QHI37978.1 hypothetical protein IMCC3317_33610 [Kordia antarctica]